jgi:hypothetical protein
MTFQFLYDDGQGKIVDENGNDPMGVVGLSWTSLLFLF